MTDQSQESANTTNYGYTSQLSRTLRTFASFAISFSFISITTGIFTTYGSVLGTTGPIGIWTWPITALGVTAVSLVFGLLASKIPLAGYSYQWMSRLANPVVGWIIGWFTFAFLVVDVVAVDFSLASTVLPSLFEYPTTAFNTWLVTALVVLLQAFVIAMSTVWAERINNIAVGTEIAGILALTILLLIIGGVKGELDWSNLFSHGVHAGQHGFFAFGTAAHAGPWVLGFLLGAFTIVGFEAASNLSEETQEAERVVPRAMWTAVVLSGAIGFVYLIAITASAGNLTKLTHSSTPVADVVIRVLGGVVGKLLLILVAYSIFACGMVIFVSASRMVWAMSRDARFPGYTGLRRIHHKRGTPMAAALLVGLLIEVVLLLFSQSQNALFQLFSAATLMPCLIYLSTVILYVATRHKLPQSRGFHLGPFEIPVIVIALVWLLFELSIFRDASFHTPWIYTGGMLVLGLIYLAVLLLRRHSLVMPTADTTLDEVSTSDRAADSDETEHS